MVMVVPVVVMVQKHIVFGVVLERAVPLLPVVVVRVKTHPVRPAWVQLLFAEWAVWQVPLGLAW